MIWKILKISRLKKVPLYHRSTGLTVKCLKYLAMLRASCCKHTAVRGMDVKHGISPASLRARSTLNGIKLFAEHCAFLTRRIQIFCLCWSKESPLMTQHFSRVSKFVQSFVRSNNTSVVFIGALARYSSSDALGRNYTRCQNSAYLEIPDTDLLTRSQCIRELLDVRDGVIDIPGLDIDEVFTTINEICCNWFPLCIICNLFLGFKVISLPLKDINAYHTYCVTS